jgi:dTDP-4-dehydrorhamnose reductase
LKGPVLIIGASGLVGTGLAKALDKSGAPWVGTSRSGGNGLLRCILSDHASIAAVANETRPDVLVLTAALTDVDYCESHPEETAETNLDGARSAVAAAKETGAKIVCFSTDYIFDGKYGPYSEDSEPSPINVYGKSKLDAEKVIAGSGIEYLIIRTTVVYVWLPGSKNFIMQLANRLSRGKTISAPIDQWGSPTEANDLGACVVELIENGATGVFNVAGPEIVSRYTFAARAAHSLGFDPGLVVPVATDELGQAAERPRRAGLLARKFAKTTGRFPIGIEEGLLRVSREMKQWKQEG